MDETLMNRVESQRLELETNVARLRKALSHWQTLELDYEGLKDEFQGLDGNVTKQQYLDSAREFAPHKVDAKELNDLIEPDKGKIRQPSQVIDTLSKRIEYVARNITSLRNQIADLEKKRNSILLAGKPEHEQEAALPIAEITEELDEDGNIISSKVQPQGETASKVLNVLEKADSQSKTAPNPISPFRTRQVEEAEDHDVGQNEHKAFSNEIVKEVKDSEQLPGRETELDQSSMSIEFPTNPQDTDEEARMRQEMLEYGFGLPEVGKIVAELELADGVNSEAESDIDVEMSDLPSDGEPDHMDDFDDDDDFSDDDSEEEEEDADGRVKTSLHSEKYKQRMDELQKHLGVQMANVGPTPDLPTEILEQIEHPSTIEAQKYIESLPPGLRKQMEPRPPAKEAARKAAIAREEASRTSQQNNDGDVKALQRASKRSKKKVAFAPELDIAQEVSDPPPSKPTTTTETVIERSAPISNKTASPPSHEGLGKTSRFKATRAANPQTPLFPPPMEFPTSSNNIASQQRGPPNKTHADTLIERSTPISIPSAPEYSGVDFDEELQKRQIALEHFNLKNKIVHEQGGYVRGGELENWGDEYAAPEVLDRATGQPKKISRFKAARMKG